MSVARAPRAIQVGPLVDLPSVNATVVTAIANPPAEKPDALRSSKIQRRIDPIDEARGEGDSMDLTGNYTGTQTGNQHCRVPLLPTRTRNDNPYQAGEQEWVVESTDESTDEPVARQIGEQWLRHLAPRTPASWPSVGWNPMYPNDSTTRGSKASPSDLADYFPQP